MADISPHLVVSDPEQALNWYRAVFEAAELSRIPLPDGTAFAIEFSIGDTHLHLAGEYPDMGIVSPATLGGTYLALQVETDDVDATFERAIAAGAKIFHPLDDVFYGERTGQFIDPFGHRWGVRKQIRDVPADEVAREVARIFGG
ncbi:MAG: Glyoxalase/bleomycin resistance protein/dioxygenase [Nocardia sp.]|uniref:VOC family protein n=1 Tax=Nocardia sp. TaxID=1821 RepID=UPI00262B95E9|nr:VOC family protein [Nocardia sp.]MCU1645573.1 Glyoxalase/bleomycin resistance protein/dioxygenase [Nocardia sp.]